MNRIEHLVMSLCPDGVEYVDLGVCAGYSNTRVYSDILDKTNFVGVDNLLKSAAGRVDAGCLPNIARLAEYIPGDILIGNIRPYLKKIWLSDRCGGSSGDVLVIRISENYANRLLSRFLFYILSSENFFSYNMQHAKGAKMPRGSKEAILRYRIPIPPMVIQEEIVGILDAFSRAESELEVALEAELEARRRQYQYYRDALLTFPERHDGDGASKQASKQAIIPVDDHGRTGRVHPWFRHPEVGLRTGWRGVHPLRTDSYALWHLGKRNTVVRQRGACQTVA